MALCACALLRYAHTWGGKYHLLALHGSLGLEVTCHSKQGVHFGSFRQHAWKPCDLSQTNQAPTLRLLPLELEKTGHSFELVTRSSQELLCTKTAEPAGLKEEGKGSSPQILHLSLFASGSATVRVPRLPPDTFCPTAQRGGAWGQGARG